MSLSHDGIHDIQWWVDNLTSSTRRISHHQPDIIIFNDASKSGWSSKTDCGMLNCGIWARVF